MENQINVLIFISFFCASFAASSSGDAAAISAVAKSLVSVPSDWHSGRNPCMWSGIDCDGGQITSIDLNSKGISGTLPDSISQLTSLKHLNLGHNQISGPIPSLAGLSALQTLDLQANAFTSVPNNLLCDLTGLQSVTLDNNPLAPWSIPLGIAVCTSLQSFSSANASITGVIPDVFGHLHNLTELKLSYNKLAGGLPPSFARSTIQSLYLNNQQEPGLSGRIDVLGAMPQLQLVWLQSNNFIGPIPDLSNLTSLASFSVGDNHLTGPVPPSLTSGQTLKNAVLSSNMLQGPFPNFSKKVTVDISNGNQFCISGPGLCNPRVMTLLSVAGGFGYPLELANSWKGNDPCSKRWSGVTCVVLGKDLIDIVALDFSHKHYTGTISPDIANLTSVREIIVSDNNLMGSIPDSLTKMPQLHLLDITNNSLSGKIPDFPPSVLLKASGNPMLGSDSSLGPSGSAGSGSTGNLYRISSSSHVVVIWGTITSVFVLVVCSASLIYYLCRKNCAQKFVCIQRRTPQNKPEGVTMDAHGEATTDLCKQSSIGINRNAYMIEAQRMIIPYSVIQKATNDFSESNLLGKGRFCDVYKGEYNGTLIAVKRNVSDIMGSEGMKEFQSEINILNKVRHRYLVALLGYCVNATERLLVYEYMPNGTLGQHLFDQNENGYSTLSWNKRLTIALDVARGIEYLHDLAQECFIHRDLKASNILLDKDMRAKVSNFGLVKLVDSEKSVMTGLVGTSGYLAPEYAITGKISTKIDVYAFGVILMELITGRRAIDNSLTGKESHIVKLFHRNFLDKKFMNYVEASLDLDEEAIISISHVAELACQCTTHEPNQRPDMGHIVNKLVPFVEKWNPSLCEDEVNHDDYSGVSLPQKLRKWQLDDGTSTWQHSTSTIDSSASRASKHKER